MSILDDILAGKFVKNPFYKLRMSACSYCVYSSVCRFDTKCGGNQYRKMTYGESDWEQPIVYEQIKKELGGKADA